MLVFVLLLGLFEATPEGVICFPWRRRRRRREEGGLVENKFLVEAALGLYYFPSRGYFIIVLSPIDSFFIN